MNRAEASQFRHAPSLRFSLFIRYVALLAFSSDYAGDAGQVIGYAEVDPVGCVQKRLDGWKTVMTQFEHQDAARFQVHPRLGDYLGIQLIAFCAAVKR